MIILQQRNTVLLLKNKLKFSGDIRSCVPTTSQYFRLKGPNQGRLLWLSFGEIFDSRLLKTIHVSPLEARRVHGMAISIG